MWRPKCLKQCVTILKLINLFFLIHFQHLHVLHCPLPVKRETVFFTPLFTDKWHEEQEFTGSLLYILCVLQSHRRHDSPEQAATYILEVGMIVMMLRERMYLLLSKHLLPMQAQWH